VIWATVRSRLLLAEKAASATGAEKLRRPSALLNLRRGEVTPALLEAFTTAAPAVKPELIRALGDRGDTSAAPRLLELARVKTMPCAPVRCRRWRCWPARRNCPIWCNWSSRPPPTTPVPKRPTRSVRPASASNPGTATVTWKRWSRRCEPGRWKRGWPCCRSAPDLAEAPVREALRAALQDSEPRVREAALRALCDTRDGELLPDLLKAASGAGEEKTRLLAVRGCVRLATQEEGVKLSNDQKLAALKTILDIPLEASEKRLVLSGLGAIAGQPGPGPGRGHAQ
jgi:hypothetical protein